MYDHPVCLQINRSDNKPQFKWAVSLVIAHGHFDIHQEVGTDMHGLTYSLYHPSGLKSS